jgi:anti-sigma B factor antagonist
VGIEVSGSSDGVTRVVLSGRLDTPGVDEIETRFAAVTVPGSKSAIVDLSRVDFVASMGIRMFITVGRSMGHRGAKLVLYGAQEMVREVFETVCLSDIVPVVATEREALATVSPSN